MAAMFHNVSLVRTIEVMNDHHNFITVAAAWRYATTVHASALSVRLSVCPSQVEFYQNCCKSTSVARIQQMKM